jgi:metal-responsive CopG/Arc/MetJ family transcriptional regulator
MTTISLKISEGLERRLTQAAKRSGKSRSALIREAVESYVVRDTKRRGSCLAVASDIIGSVAGPADLSHNKKRMKGFGR